MTKTKFLDLPNELFPLIFQYLKSTDILYGFFNMQSYRIRALVNQCMSHVDISRENDQWIETNFPELIKLQRLIAVRLQDKHINSILKYLPSSNIQLMHVHSSDWQTDLLKTGLDYCRQYIKHLSIKFTHPHGKEDVASHLFRSDSQFEYLNIAGRFLFFNSNEINTCPRLTHLSIELEGMHRVFILMKNLPNLQRLKVKFRMEERIIQPTFSTDHLMTCKRLCQVTFVGCTKYFEHLETFFTVFGSTIEFLTVNIDLMYEMIDGQRLEHKFLGKMPYLSSLNLIIHSLLNHSPPIDIGTFQSLCWQMFNPIGYWNDVQAHQHTIFTLPYKAHKFKHLSNDFISSCMTNRVAKLDFEYVRVLSIILTTPLTVDLFEFVRKAFLNIKTLQLTNPRQSSEFEKESLRKKNTSFMTDALISNDILQLPSITRFSFLLLIYYDNYNVFHRFLHLLPNLVYLQIFIGRSLYREILAHQQEDEFVRTSLNRIRRLQRVPFYNEKDIVADEEIQSLFPNAQLFFDYDDI